MKIILLTLVSLSVSIQLRAQIFYPIPESDAVWIQASFLYTFGAHEHTTITNPLSFGQDTIIGTETYHSLHGHEIVEWVDGWGNQQNYATGTYTNSGGAFYFRQDIPNKKVFAWVGNQDTLLYDFNLTVGQVYPQTLTNIDYPNLLVMSQDSIQLLDGLYHKQWNLGTNSADSAYISILEGVGATSGFNLLMYPLFEQSGATMCIKVNENQLYDNWINNGSIIPAKYSDDCAKNVSLDELIDNENELKIWPNPCSEKIYFRGEDQLQSIEIADIFGKVIVTINEASEIKEIDLSSFENGNYFVTTIIANQKHVQKLVKR